MNKLLTYLLGSDYIEQTQLSLKSASIESIKNDLSNILFPDSIKSNPELKSLVFIQKLYPRFESEFRQIYFIHTIKSTIYESKPNILDTRYYMDGGAKIQRFLSSLVILGISAFLLSQYFISYPINIINFNSFIWLALIFSVVLKAIEIYFINADIEHYQQKLAELAI